MLFEMKIINKIEREREINVRNCGCGGIGRDEAKSSFKDRQFPLLGAAPIRDITTCHYSKPRYT